jgi:putative ABC transport system ATP-binding protein
LTARQRGLGRAFETCSPLLNLEGVSRKRGTGVDSFLLEIERLTVRPGDRLAIIGRSGVGKSTCLDLLALTLAPTTAEHFLAGFGGEVLEIGELWRQRDLRSLARLRAKYIGYVLQTGGLLPFLNVRDNATLPLRLLGLRSPTAWEFADDLLERLSIAAFATRLPADLSLGQRQRVAVARALAHRPQLVLADEPTASLDGHTGAAVMELFVELVRSERQATVLVTHSEALARDYGFIPIACQPLQESEAGSHSRVLYDGAC